MKALFIYSRFTGNSAFIKKLDYIKDRLKTKFDVLDMIETHTLDELRNECHRACQTYDYLIFVGGDGTVNKIINYVSIEERRPILGYIPGGTTNDFAKNYHLSTRINKAVENIVNGTPIPFDVVKANDKYFVYVLACGAFSEISYSAKRKIKRLIGDLSYYLLAIKDSFIPKKIEGTLVANNKIYKVNTPFLLVLNSKYVGGFPVSFKNKINDGKFQIFITKPGLFNGLVHYALFKMRTDKISTDEFTFAFKNKPSPWCVDGEKEDLNNVHVKLFKSHLKIIVPNRYVNKLTK